MLELFIFWRFWGGRPKGKLKKYNEGLFLRFVKSLICNMYILCHSIEHAKHTCFAKGLLKNDPTELFREQVSESLKIEGIENKLLSAVGKAADVATSMTFNDKSNWAEEWTFFLEGNQRS